MYCGKHSRKKKPLPMRMSALIFSIILLCSAVIGGTTAYLIANTDSVTNTFTLATVSCEVTESFNGVEKSNVCIKNTGTADAYIRAAIVVTWEDDKGNIYPKTPVAQEDYTISLNSVKWISKGGFYYYADPVAPGKSTKALIDSCSPIAGRAPDGCHLNVTIIASAIQSTPAEAVTGAWGVSVVNGSIQ